MRGASGFVSSIIQRPERWERQVVIPSGTALDHMLVNSARLKAEEVLVEVSR